MDIKLIDALNEMRTWIPLQREDEQSLMDLLECKFTAYIDLLKNIKRDEFSRIFVGEEKSCGKNAFVNLMVQIQQTIQSAISDYDKGYPSKAYEYIWNLLSKNTLLSKDTHHTSKYANGKLCEPLGHYFGLKFEEKGVGKDYFRMRISGKVLSKGEMFHIPLDQREIVSTQRFSIPGYPCLYLGTSLNVCWDEIKRKMEENEKTYACRFQKKGDKPLVLLSLKIPGEFAEDDFESYSALCFLLTFPFYLSCLIQTKYPERPFKPEYIMPQLLLQYVNMTYDDCLLRFDGIIYPSTKSIPFTGDGYNIVIPYRPGKVKDEKYSSILMDMFPYTTPVVVEADKIEKTEEALGKLKLSSLKV